MSFENSLSQCGSSMGSQVLLGDLLPPLQESACLCQELVLAQASHMFTAFSQTSTCSSVGLLHEQQVDFCIPVVLHGLQRVSCFSMVFTTDCRGISSPMLGAPPLLPSTDLAVCRVVPLTYSHPSFLWPKLYPHSNFFLLKNVIIEALLPFLIGPVLTSSGHLGTSWH